MIEHALPHLATQRSAALELRLNHPDWIAVCLALRDLAAWQQQAAADISALDLTSPTTCAALRHAITLAQSTLLSLRFTIENALNKRGLSSAAASTDRSTRVLVRHSALSSLAPMLMDHADWLSTFPDERLYAKGLGLLAARINEAVSSQLQSVDRQAPVPF
ncbi:hypothetical protein [Labrys sp. 22185]|uniref:hypothetical protein n=1 Tax=Labrys sp. 22185 TaxID=3453888 RepID=UPI003F83E601